MPARATTAMPTNSLLIRSIPFRQHTPRTPAKEPARPPPEADVPYYTILHRKPWRPTGFQAHSSQFAAGWRPCLRKVVPRATVELPTQKPPAGQTHVHERAEPRSMVVDGKMRVLVNDDILDERTRRMCKLGIVGDVPLAPVATAPQGLHATDLPRDTSLPQSRRPEHVQLVQRPGKAYKVSLRDRRADCRQTRENLTPRFRHPRPLVPQEPLALRKRCPEPWNRQPNRAIRTNADVDSPRSRTDNLDGYAVNLIQSDSNHGAHGRTGHRNHRNTCFRAPSRPQTSNSSTAESTIVRFSFENARPMRVSVLPLPANTSA